MRTQKILNAEMVSIFFMLLIPGICLADSGDLDPSFGNGGIVITDTKGLSFETATAVKVQSDGKMVAVGFIETLAMTYNDIVLARFNTDGSLDMSFGVGGTVILPIDSYDDKAWDLAFQGDKIVVAGSIGSSGPYYFSLLRFHSDGSLDTTFGNNGIVTLGHVSSAATAVHVLPDGKILAAGYMSGGSGAHILLARYLQDGTLDTTFGPDGNGWVLTNPGVSQVKEKANDMAILSDGKILLGGISFHTNDNDIDFALACFSSEGILDTTFGTDGWVITDFGTLEDIANKIAIQPVDGKILLAGKKGNTGTAQDFAIARYNADGSLDTSFGTGGKVTTDLGSSGDTGLGLAVLLDGKILQAGLRNKQGTHFAFTRYNSSGSLDTAFGSNGLLTIEGFEASEQRLGLALDSAGRVVVPGRVANDLAVARLDTNGNLDGGFGDGGIVSVAFPGSNLDVGNAVAFQGDGKIVMAGYATNVHAGDHACLVRYHPDGTLDTTFGNGGVVLTHFGGDDHANDVVIQPDNKIVAACTRSSYLSVLRYLPDGTPDPDFGTGGMASPNCYWTFARSLAMQPDGKIVVAGGTKGNDIFLARFHADGSMDGTFGINGCVVTNLAPPNATLPTDSAASDVVIQGSKILVAGYVKEFSGDNDFIVLRYNEDGTLDETFGTGGRATMDFGIGNDSAAEVAIQPGGKIVVGGYAGNDFALACYDADGTLDASFGTGGLVTTDFEGTAERGYGMAIQNDGGIVLAGYRNSGNYSLNDFAVARYQANGSLDTNFGTGGWVVTDFSGDNDVAYGMGLQPDGMIVLVGPIVTARTIRGAYIYDIGLARYIGSPPNTVPIAAAGTGQTVHPGTLVTLDGGGSSDPDGNYPLTYAWQITFKPAGSAAELADASTVNPSFTPDLMSDYMIELVVTDSQGAQSSPATVVISTINTDPVADAGLDQALLCLNTTVQLDGSQSYDEDGDYITYSWKVNSQPPESTASLANPFSIAPTFEADAYGVYIINLAVIDEYGAVSTSDEVTISFENIWPVADAGGSQGAFVGDLVILDGSGSFDVNCDFLKYTWSLVSKPAASQAELVTSTTVSSSLVPDWPGTYVVSLVVNDGLLDSKPDNVNIEVVSSPGVLVQLLLDLIEGIRNLDEGDLKNRNMRKSLVNKVNAVLSKVEKGQYQEALDKLEDDILQKTNGCADSGMPDKNDWIITCDAQGQIHPLIIAIIANLEALI